VLEHFSCWWQNVQLWELTVLNAVSALIQLHTLQAHVGGTMKLYAHIKQYEMLQETPSSLQHLCKNCKNMRAYAHYFHFHTRDVMADAIDHNTRWHDVIGCYNFGSHVNITSMTMRDCTTNGLTVHTWREWVVTWRASAWAFCWRCRREACGQCWDDASPTVMRWD